MAVSEEQRKKDIEDLKNILNSAFSSTPGSSSSSKEPEENFNIDFEMDQQEESTVKVGSSKAADIDELKDIINSAFEQEEENENTVDTDTIILGERGEHRDNKKFSEEIEKQIRDDRIISSIRGIRYTMPLINANYSNYVYESYLNKYIVPSINRMAFDFADRNEKSRHGLKVASIVISNMVALYNLKGIGDINQFKSFAYESIDSSKGNTLKYKIALGMVKAYDREDLEFDQMPSAVMLKAFVESYNTQEQLNRQTEPEKIIENIQLAPGDNSIDSLKQAEADAIDWLKQEYIYPDEDSYVPESMYESDETGHIKFKPRSTQCIFEMTNDDYVAASAPKYEVAYRFRRKLFESSTGFSYECKKKWDFVMSSIDYRFTNRGDVIKIAVVGSILTVNGKMIDCNGLLHDENNELEMQDILRIRHTLKRYKNIKEVILDSDATSVLMHEYGDNAGAMWDVFKENKALETIGLIPFGGSKPVEYYRNSFKNTTDTFDKQIGANSLKMQIEQFSAIQNPNINTKSKAYVHRNFGDKVYSIGDRTKHAGDSALSNGWELTKKAGRAVMADKFHVGSVLRFSAGAVVIIGLGSVLALGGRTITGTKKLIEMFR